MFRRSGPEGYEPAAPGIRRKTLCHGEATLLTEFRLDAGHALPMHEHPHEQTGYLVAGGLRMTIGGETFDVGPGDGWCIPGGTAHGADVLLDTVAVEVFSPVREDYLPVREDFSPAREGHPPAPAGALAGAPAIRSVLCFGDSNTWGTDPADAARRFPWGVRWPSVLQRELGAGTHVVEEGLGGRTTVIDDPLSPHRSGLELLAPALESHAPLDLVILQLGTNDISYSWVTAPAAADGAGTLAHLVRRSEAGPEGGGPQVLLVCPPPVGPFGRDEDAALWEGAEEKSRALPQEFARVAATAGFPWFDAGRVVVTSPLDGWHLEAGEHVKLGVALAAEVRRLLA